MDHDNTGVMAVKARLDLPFALIELQHIDSPGEIDSDLPAIDAYRIDLSLTPRTPAARMSFRNRWPADRFETLGKVYLVPPGEAVRARSGAGTQEAVVCFLRQSSLDAWLESNVTFVGRSLDMGLDIRNSEVARLMSKLAEEARHPGFAHHAMCEALSIQIAVELGRHYTDCDRGGVSSLAGWRLALIEERLREARVPPTLTELARLCCISTRHLTRAFRASHGCSIGSHIRTHQVEAAKRALDNGECVKEIAHKLGFASRSSFSQAFRKSTGMAPQQFRQQRLAGRSSRGC